MSETNSDVLDQLLVLHAQAGDRQAMDELVRRWQKRLWLHARRLTSDNEAAWDVTQQTWLAVIKGLGRLHDSAHFKTWLYRIATNKAIDHYKANPRPLPQLDRPAGPDSEPDCDLNDLLAVIDPDRRAALVLYYFEGLSVAEAAAVLGVPEGTVKSRLHYARDDLRKIWRQYRE